MAIITNGLDSFDTNKVSLNNALITIKTPLATESEQTKEIIKEKYDSFRKAYPEAENLRHEIYIYLCLENSMNPKYSFEIIIYDSKQGITKNFDLWQAEYNLSNEEKEEITQIVWKQLHDLMFGK